MSKTFTINIDATALNGIRAAAPALNMCIAKMVNSEYTAVWGSIAPADLMETNMFTFTDDYQAFSVAPGPLPAVGAVIVPIAPTAVGTGQTIVFDGTIFTPPTGNVSSSRPLTVTNNDLTAAHYFGLNATLNRPGPGAIRAAIHLSPFQTLANNSTAFNPTNRIKVWFQQDWVDNTFIPTAAGKGISIDLTKANDVSVRFNNTNTWSLLTSDSLPIQLCAKECDEDALHLVSHTEAEYLILFTHGVCAGQRMQFFKVFNSALATAGRKVVSVKCESPCSFRVKMQFSAFMSSPQFFWDNVINDINNALRTVLNNQNINLLSALETWQIITVNICERKVRLLEDVSVLFEDCTNAVVCGADDTNPADCAACAV